MPDLATALASRWLRWAGLIAGLVVLFYFVPLFHLVPLKTAQEQAATAVFDAAGFVDRFWQGPLLESAQQAVDAAELLDAFHTDFAAAAERHGHRLGLSGTSAYFVSGQGRIIAADGSAILIALSDEDQADVVIETGPVFGNAIRDGSGLLDVSDYSNVQDFNAISAEINRRVEEQIFPVLLANPGIGATIRFAGGLEVTDSAGAPEALRVVPVVIEFP